LFWFQTTRGLTCPDIKADDIIGAEMESFPLPHPERVRTTVAFEPGVHAEASRLYGLLGYRKMGDLVNEAVREYLARQQTLLKDRAMEEAARDEGYRAILREVSEDFARIDSEGLPDY
jgi:hypothetical protein